MFPGPSPGAGPRGVPSYRLVTMRAFVLTLLLSASWTVACVPQCLAQGDTRPLVMTGRDDLNPYLGRGPDGHAHGAYAEIWRLWARSAGVDLDIRLAPGDVSRQMLLDGRADFMVTAATEDQEDPRLAYSSPFDRLQAYIFHRAGLSGITGISGPQDLAGLRVGVLPGDPVGLRLMSVAPFGTVFVPYRDVDALVTAADSGEVHAFVAPLRVGAYHLARLGVTRDFKYAKSPVAALPLRAAVLKDRVDLMQRIRAGLRDMPPETIEAIRAKWDGRKLPAPFPWQWLAMALGLSAALVAGFLTWNWQLRRRVRLATDELREANQALSREVTERKRAEAELAAGNLRLERRVGERTTDLARKARELEEANVRLMELDEMKSLFLSSVSHEFRTPLTSIMGFAKLIAKDIRRVLVPALPSEPALAVRCGRIQDNLSIIVEDGLRLTRLVNDVLDLDRIESGRTAWNDQDVLPADVVHQCLRSARGYFAANPAVTLEADIAPNLPCMRLDPDKLEQVLANLLSNAAKFTQKGVVCLSAHARNGHLNLRVDDTGRGIEPGDLERVFDKFHQVTRGDTLESKPKGTGLGLTICRHIVEHYQGRIWAESVVGLGSSFHVVLPVDPGEGE